jgi:hypothetical protein
MYTVYSYFKGRMLPCVFAFMSRKSEEDYKRDVGCVITAPMKLGLLIF